MRRPTIHRSASVLALMAAAALPLASCGGDDGTNEDAGQREPTEAEVQAFCDAVEALDATDGTTEDDVVLDAIAQLRRAAPAPLRADVELLADTMVANDYPDAADESMQVADPQDRQPASERVSGFVDERCELGDR